MSLRLGTSLASLALLTLLGCSKNPADSAPKAQVAQAAQPAAAEAAPAGQEALRIDPAASKVGFVGAKVTGSHDGGFKTFSGTVHLDPKTPEASRIEVDIDVASVWTDNERLTGHLKSGDFFLVEEHPTARFVSTAIKPAAAGAAGGATHEVTGNLTLRGQTRTISFPAVARLDSWYSFDEHIHRSS